ncbi:hypothetical protein [Novacetimonas hansenii]|uniref:hypothetical protein n=1 Tax=Novacetimonas hansenii TaxID=436 RepID=UPI000798CF25|nr:hypothetical protein [Novacetimonas hansenii]WEQ59853.1 hypothetical protein LV563_04775 [Novacetimonas hansenii]CUW47945.1 hypothetical protein ATCC53582_02069 [Novacetimonas hansenii]
MTSLMIYPGIDGLCRVASSFDWIGAKYEEPANGQALRLKHVENRENGVLWLQYDVEKGRPE